MQSSFETVENYRKNILRELSLDCATSNKKTIIHKASAVLKGNKTIDNKAKESKKKQAVHKEPKGSKKPRNVEFAVRDTENSQINQETHKESKDELSDIFDVDWL